MVDKIEARPTPPFTSWIAFRFCVTPDQPISLEIRSNPRRPCLRVELDCTVFGNKTKNGADALMSAAVKAIKEKNPDKIAVIELMLTGSLNLNRIALDLTKAALEIAEQAGVFALSIDTTRLNIGSGFAAGSVAGTDLLPRDELEKRAILQLVDEQPLWETWETRRIGSNWQASNGAKFNLNSNQQRPAGWTSGDAAGLPMFPALVRYDEAERGMVEHACRLVVKRTRYNHFIYPATHYAAPPANTSSNLPAMGQRLRLKASFVIPENWNKEEKAVLRGLKKYGALVADNGNVFSISVTPDDRWPAKCFDHLRSISVTNFEVVQTTGPSEWPRSTAK